MVGDRIKLGRLASALSLQELAEALEESGYKITRAALSKYETGKIPPSDAFLTVLANALGIGLSFFTQKDWPDPSIMLYQEKAIVPKQEAELMAFLRLKLEQHLLIDKLLQIQSSPFCPESITPDPAHFQEEIDALAQRLRVQWGNQAQVIASVCGLLESNGWYVFEIPSLFGVESVAGIETGTGRPFLAFCHAETVDDTRFHMMKEVGRMFLRCDDKCCLDEMCCSFSRAMLLPRQFAQSEPFTALSVADYSTFSLLKQRYGVSKVQIRIRLQDLELYAVGMPKSTMKTVERIQARKLMDSKIEPLYFYENTILFKLRVLEASRRGLISAQMTSTLLPKRYA